MYRTASSILIVVHKREMMDSLEKKGDRPVMVLEVEILIEIAKNSFVKNRSLEK